MKFVLAGYGSRGDVEPFLAVGRELLRRGHDVHTAVPPNMLAFAESAGLAATGYGPDSREEMNPASELARSILTKSQSPVGILTEVIGHISQVKAEKSATLASLAKGADLLLAGVNEQGLAANIAEYYAIPCAALHTFPARLWAAGGPGTAITKETDDAQRGALGLSEQAGPSTRPVLEIQGYDELCLPGSSVEWVERHDRRPFVGALSLELPTDTDDEVLSWIAAGSPPIYFGFGSTLLPSFAETVAGISAVCAHVGERALICGGSNDMTDVPQSEHVKVVGEVNHALVFPMCRAAVHHGGAGTTAANLRAGIPALILWFWLDQPVWAAAIEQLEAGGARPFSESTRDSLIADLRSILIPHCVIRAREVGAQMTQSADSVARAADLLEDIAGHGHPA